MAVAACGGLSGPEDLRVSGSEHESSGLKLRILALAKFLQENLVSVSAPIVLFI